MIYPVFPLARGLVPSMQLSLQIFEQRYLRMVRDCMERGLPFVVSPLSSGAEVGLQAEFPAAGCLARVVDWDTLPSGLLGIRVEGDQRVALAAPEQEADGLWQTEATALQDSRQLALPEDYSGIRELLQQITPGEIRFEVLDCSEIGWMLAAALPMEASSMASLLMENDPVERMEMLVQLVDRLAQR